MNKRIIETSNAPAAIGPYSQAVWAGDLLFASGQIALDPQSGAIVEGDVAAQAHQVMKNIGALLDAAGLGYAHIIKSSIFLKSMNDFGAINDVYASYLQQPYPARETVEVSRLPKDV